MDIRIVPHKLSGSVTPPPSKSMAHRLLIAAALGDTSTTVRNVTLSKDIEATLRCIEVLGGRWERIGADIRITGIRKDAVPPAETLCFDCGESGSTLRFFIPIALALAGGGTFVGHGRLMERPQQPYAELFREKGVSFSQENGAIRLSGQLTPGLYALPGNVSSQFFTGLFYALPLLDDDSTVLCTTAWESEDYALMTLDAIATAGIRIRRHADGLRFTVPHGVYQPAEQTVEADWSQAGFWYAANHLGAELTVEGLSPHSLQGDRALAPLSQRLAQPGELEIDISGCPDLLPPLAVMAAVRQGTTHFMNAARLRMKESDRLHTVCALIHALGGQAAEGTDSLTVCGQPHLCGGTVCGANDHRIVMAAAIAACGCTGDVTILGAEAVDKSYPNFFAEYSRLGGNVDVL